MKQSLNFNSSSEFPNPEQADDEGLVMVGGTVSAETVLAAYKKGIFPWFDSDLLPLWWSPDPRCVLFPDELHISRSMYKLLHQSHFEFRLNFSFETVLENCATIKRNNQQGSWITSGIQQAYLQLFKLGFGWSAETWFDDELVGGIYGVKLGNVYFGESMFSVKSNASKFALFHLVELMKKQGAVLLDCQVYSPHLASLGARTIPRKQYLDILTRNIPAAGQNLVAR